MDIFAGLADNEQFGYRWVVRVNSLTGGRLGVHLMRG